MHQRDIKEKEIDKYLSISDRIVYVKGYEFHVNNNRFLLNAYIHSIFSQSNTEKKRVFIGNTCKPEYIYIRLSIYIERNSARKQKSLYIDDLNKHREKNNRIIIIIICIHMRIEHL